VFVSRKILGRAFVARLVGARLVFYLPCVCVCAASMAAYQAGSSSSSSGSGEDENGWATVPKARRQIRPKQEPLSPAYNGHDGSWNEDASRPPVHQPRSNGYPGASHAPALGRTQSGPTARSSRENADKKVFVSGLTLSTTDGVLVSAYKHCGRITEAYVARTHEQVSRGFGFVTFAETAGATMAAREGGVRVDGKLCQARLYVEGKGEGKGQGPSGKGKGDGKVQGDGTWIEGASHSEARQEVNNFVTKYELSCAARFALSKADAKTALRVVRAIDSCNQGVSEGLVHVELQKVARSNLSPELEKRIVDWVHSTGLSEEWTPRVESVLMAQRPEEIEHILQEGQTHWFLSEIRKKDLPHTWLLSKVQHYRRKKTLQDVQVFCERFCFDEHTEQQLSDISLYHSGIQNRPWPPTKTSISSLHWLACRPTRIAAPKTRR